MSLKALPDDRFPLQIKPGDLQRDTLSLENCFPTDYISLGFKQRGKLAQTPSQETIAALLITSHFLRSYKAICIEWVKLKQVFAVVAIERAKCRKRQMKKDSRED